MKAQKHGDPEDSASGADAPEPGVVPAHDEAQSLVSPDAFDALVDFGVRHEMGCPPRRRLVLRAISAELMAGLPLHDRPLDQVISDLRIMSHLPGALVAGAPPLLEWIDGASRIVGPEHPDSVELGTLAKAIRAADESIEPAVVLARLLVESNAGLPGARRTASAAEWHRWLNRVSQVGDSHALAEAVERIGSDDCARVAAGALSHWAADADLKDDVWIEVRRKGGQTTLRFDLPALGARGDIELRDPVRVPLGRGAALEAELRRGRAALRLLGPRDAGWVGARTFVWVGRTLLRGVMTLTPNDTLGIPFEESHTWLDLTLHMPIDDSVGAH